MSDRAASLPTPTHFHLPPHPHTILPRPAIASRPVAEKIETRQNPSAWLKGASDVRIDGRDSKGFAPRTTTSKTAQRLLWCGHDSSLIANGFMLRAPMVYSSLEAPVDDEPSCINLSLDAEPPGRIAEPGPGTYPTYAGLSPAHRARYLLWLSKDRASSLEHIGFAFLYLCGLERRLFLDRSDLHEIVKEFVRLRASYSSARVFGLRAINSWRSRSRAVRSTRPAFRS